MTTLLLESARDYRQTLACALCWLAAVMCLPSAHAQATPTRARWTLRASHLTLPYGMRVPSQFLWQRDVTRGERDRPANDLAGLANNPLSMRNNPLAYVDEHKTVLDPFRERGYSGFAQYDVSSSFAVGATLGLTDALADRISSERLNTVRANIGGFARVRFSRVLTLFAEGEVLYASRIAASLSALLQLDYQPLRGLHFLCTAQLTQQGAQRGPGEVNADGWSEHSELLAGGWLSVDWLLTQHFEVRVDALAHRDAGSELVGRFRTFF